MTASADCRRKEERRAFDGVVTLSTASDGDEQKFIRGRAVDFSKSGARVQSPEAIDVGSQVYLRADSFGLMGMAKVRYCQQRPAGYVIGLELEKRGSSMRTPDDFIDYYEVLQISPKADSETIHRVFRMQASRYHPDNKQSGNAERFMLLSRIYETLVDPKKREQYDIRRRMREPGAIPVFGLAEFVAGVEGEVNRRLGVLCLLYKRRRSNPDHPSLSLLQLEFLMEFPREHLMFTVNYLREKDYIRIVENSDYQITAGGIDSLEAGVRGKQIFQHLLEAPLSITGSAR
jgi:DnaJ-domain-containing protein 1